MKAGTAAALAAALLLGACSDDDEIDAESAAILSKVPRGSGFRHAVNLMQQRGFTCNAGQIEYRTTTGEMWKADAHLRCERDERFVLACTKRTSVILIQANGRLMNVLVNIGRFC